MAVILVKQNTVKLRSKDTRLIRIPRYYGQFSLSLGKESPYFLRLRTRSVFGSFGVMLMSCKVNFHVVRSAFQNSVCLLSVYLCWSGLL